MPTKEEIKAALKYMDDNWSFQSNDEDAKTKFIYTSDTIDEIRKHSERNDVNFNYALHRWYNFNCAKIHEQLFIDNGAKQEPDTYHKTIDFYLFDIPFDLKTSVFPKAISDRTNYSLSDRKGKNNLIDWLYKNQSKQQRFHLANRLFLVVESIEDKSKFEEIEQKIKAFISYSKANGFNKIKLNGRGIYSDIIYIPN